MHDRIDGSVAAAQERGTVPAPLFGARAAGMRYVQCPPVDPTPLPTTAALARLVQADLRAAMSQGERGMVVQQGRDEAQLMRRLMHDLPAGAMPSVVMTSFSVGVHDCTRRIDYAGGGALPVVRTTGNGCS